MRTSTVSIGTGISTPSHTLHLFITTSPTVRFMVEAHEGRKSKDIWGAFATLEEMHVRHLDQALPARPPFTHAYADGESQGLTVSKLNQQELLFAIQRPLHGGGPGAPHLYLVSDEKMFKAVGKLVPELFAALVGEPPPLSVAELSRLIADHLGAGKLHPLAQRHLGNAMAV